MTNEYMLVVSESGVALLNAVFGPAVGAKFVPIAAMNLDNNDTHQLLVTVKPQPIAVPTPMQPVENQSLGETPKPLCGDVCVDGVIHE